MQAAASRHGAPRLARPQTWQEDGQRLQEGAEVVPVEAVTGTVAQVSGRHPCPSSPMLQSHPLIEATWTWDTSPPSFLPLKWNHLLFENY